MTWRYKQLPGMLLTGVPGLLLIGSMPGLGLLAGCLSGCAQNPTPDTSSFAPAGTTAVSRAASSSVSDSTPPAASSALPEQELSEEAQSVPAQPGQPGPVSVQLSSAQRVDTAGIEKISTAIRQDQEPRWELPGILSFENGCVFTERMGSDYTVVRYDLNGQAAAESLSFEMHFMAPGMLTLSRDKMVCAPSGYSAEKECGVTLLDFAAKRVLKILEEPFAWTGSFGTGRWTFWINTQTRSTRSTRSRFAANIF